jgi:hypothetical protein
MGLAERSAGPECGALVAFRREERPSDQLRDLRCPMGRMVVIDGPIGSCLCGRIKNVPARRRPLREGRCGYDVIDK